MNLDIRRLRRRCLPPRSVVGLSASGCDGSRQAAGTRPSKLIPTRDGLRHEIKAQRQCLLAERLLHLLLLFRRVLSPDLNQTLIASARMSPLWTPSTAQSETAPESVPRAVHASVVVDHHG